MSKFTFIVRGFCPSIWWFFYVYSKSRVNFIRQACTLIYMWITSKNGGYVGRTTIIESLPDLPHGFHGVHISRDAHIGKQCVIYQNVTIGGGKNGVPYIRNNVFIGAGAILIGGITIGNNVKIGAGAIVVENIPDDCTVVSEKAKIIKTW